MNKSHTKTIEIEEFVTLVKNETIKSLYKNSELEFLIKEDTISLSRPNVESIYELLKLKDGKWMPYYENDVITIEKTKYGVILLTVYDTEVGGTIILTEDLVWAGHTYVPEDIDKVYSWLEKGDVFKNTMIQTDKEYTITINNKDYNEITILDYEADEEAGEILLCICDIEDVDIQQDYVNITYRLNSDETNTATLQYKEN